MPDQDVIHRAILAWYGLPPDERPPVEDQVEDMRRAIRVVLVDMNKTWERHKPSSDTMLQRAWLKHYSRSIGIDLEAKNDDT